LKHLFNYSSSIRNWKSDIESSFDLHSQVSGLSLLTSNFNLKCLQPSCHSRELSELTDDHENPRT
ncbi:hypothetical protein STEG23_012273, partial [Scotinomys teguina]